MRLAAISPESTKALCRALQYWADHWDFECPTLFGIELDELNGVLAHWPEVAPGTEHVTSLALLGALRELLYGASAVPKPQVLAVTGLSYERAHALCSEVQAMVQPYLAA